MKENVNKFLNYKNLFIILIFSFLLIIGFLIYDDYGISWDEVSHRANGFVALNYLRNMVKSYMILNLTELIHLLPTKLLVCQLRE